MKVRDLAERECITGTVAGEGDRRMGIAYPPPADARRLRRIVDGYRRNHPRLFVRIEGLQAGVADRRRPGPQLRPTGALAPGVLPYFPSDDG